MNNREALEYWRQIEKNERLVRRDQMITEFILIGLVLAFFYALL